MRAPVFTGVCTALVTPFHESGGIDYDTFAKLIDYQISAKTAAICVCGTTGEAATLTANEQADLIRFAVKQANGKLKVIAGSGSNCTATALEHSLRAQEAGADALLIVTPYYNKTTQTGLARHYERIASQIDIPIILYNVPSRTGMSFQADTYAELAQIPNINGVKEASGNLALISHTKEKCPSDFFIWSGNDDQVVSMMALGAVGVVSVAANIIPEVMTQMCNLCLNGAFPAAADIQIEYTDLLDALFVEVNPTPIKAAMGLLNMCPAHVRLPLCLPSSQNLSHIRSALYKAALL